MGKLSVQSVTVGSLLLILSSCSTLFPTSPYSSVISTEYSQMISDNLSQLRPEAGVRPEITLNSQPAIKIAFISDTHSKYDPFHEAVNSINGSNSIAAVFHLGDMTEGGLAREYQFTARELIRISAPWFPLIGNHDYLSGGSKTYDKLFGSPSEGSNGFRSFTTTIHSENLSVRVILWDNTVWEASNRTPDLAWLETACQKGKAEADQTIVLAHIPPWTDQMSPWGEQYDSILQKYGVAASFHGHAHVPEFKQESFAKPYCSSSVHYRIVGSIEEVGAIYAEISKTEVVVHGGGEL